ncbi:MAG TPA: ATP-binding protein [Terriglobales bacterium]
MTLSVRGRLTLWYLVVLGVSLILVEVVVYLAVRGSIGNTIDDDLQARLVATVDFLKQHINTDSPAEFQDEFEEYSASRPGGELLQISDSSGNWVFQSASLRKYAISPARPDSAAQGKAFRTLTVEGRTVLRVLEGEVRLNPKVYLIQVATDTTQSLSVLYKLRWLLLILTPLSLGLATAGGYWLSTRALEPVMQITSEARLISTERLHQRLEVPQTSDELQSLAETLNAMLARIESSFKRTTQFTADASHELRTPITIIRTTAEIALRGQKDDTAYKKALSDLLEEAERTGTLIDDLLTLARLDSAQPPTLVAVDLTKAVESAFIRISPWTEHKHITASLKITNDPIWIRGDEESLIRLFFILLENAVKYTPPEGNIRASIQTAGDQVTVEVHDLGIGIPAADIPHIFDRFYRVDKARSREQGGFGLGLAIAKSIAQMHGAQLSVKSIEGQGSSFRVVFAAPDLQS